MGVVTRDMKMVREWHPFAGFSYASCLQQFISTNALICAVVAPIEVGYTIRWSI